MESLTHNTRSVQAEQANILVSDTRKIPTWASEQAHPSHMFPTCFLRRSQVVPTPVCYSTSLKGGTPMLKAHPCRVFPVSHLCFTHVPPVSLCYLGQKRLDWHLSVFLSGLFQVCFRAISGVYQWMFSACSVLFQCLDATVTSNQTHGGTRA